MPPSPSPLRLLRRLGMVALCAAALGCRAEAPDDTAHVVTEYHHFAWMQLELTTSNCPGWYNDQFRQPSVEPAELTVGADGSATLRRFARQPIVGQLQAGSLALSGLQVFRSAIEGQWVTCEQAMTFSAPPNRNEDRVEATFDEVMWPSESSTSSLDCSTRFAVTFFVDDSIDF